MDLKTAHRRTASGQAAATGQAGGREGALALFGRDLDIAADGYPGGHARALADQRDARVKPLRRARVGRVVASAPDLRARANHDLLVADDPVEHGVRADDGVVHD